MTYADFIKDRMMHTEKKETANGYPCVLTKSKGKNLKDYKIYGNSMQATSPMPESPVEIQSVGDYDAETSKYKIPVVVGYTVTNIFLDEPLRKIGDYTDYIDFKNRKVIRNIANIDMINQPWYKSGNKFILFNAPDLLNIYHNTGYYSPSLILCTHYKAVSWGSTADKRISTYYDGTNLYFGISEPQYTEVESFKSSLENVKCLCALGMPSEETVELPDIPTKKGDTTITTNTAISPSNIWVKYISR